MGTVITAFTAEDVRNAEEPVLARERGFSGGLMHRAATALATAARRDLRRGAGRVAGTTVVGLIGPGNNGGDTLHALAALARQGVDAVAITTSAAVHDAGRAALESAGGRMLGVVDGAPGRAVGLDEAVVACMGADVVLDGLLGLGGRGGLRGAAAELVTALSDARSGTRPRVIAVDVPSGIGVDDGTVPGPVLRADRTLTFGVAKPGLLLPPAAAEAGSITVVDLGLDQVLTEQQRVPAVRRLAAPDVAELWPVPGAGDHKYSRGVVGVVAGSAAYPGAAVLTVGGAIGAGCGMVRHVGAEAVRHTVLAAHPEVVTGATTDVRVQSWVVGPGIGDDDEQSGRAGAALAHAIVARVPVVVDAGSLEGLPEHCGPLVVLTPHAGELSGLLAARGITADRAEIEAAPLRWAREAAERTGATVLLKGHTTVVVGHGEQGAVVLAQRDAPAWLATAGAGDVLAGVLGALLAGRADDVRTRPELVAHLAAAAALVCGAAADSANPGGPISAGMVTRSLPSVIGNLLAGDHPRVAGRGHIGVHRAARRVVRT